MMSLAEMPDNELMKMLAGRKSESEAAFREIYARYSQRIYAYCHRVLDYSEESNDIYQDTFVKFFETYKQNLNVSNIRGMLIRIARNLCLNYKRDSKYSIEFDEMKMPVYDKSFDDDELVDLIAKAVKMLDFEHREAFVLRNYEGMSYQEIGEILGQNVSTIRNRVVRAKEKIKDILQPYLEELE